VERWHFTRAPDHSGGYSWRWQHTIEDACVDKSPAAYETLWGCVKDATRAGFDATAMPPQLSVGSFVVEIANPRKDMLRAVFPSTPKGPAQ
jgi:hypothetical protein